MVLLTARARDLETLVLLNEANVENLSPLTVTELEALAKHASYFRVAEIAGKIAGFLLAVPREAAHQSDNFQWFKVRYASFVYVDRVVVGADVRRAGVASALYADLAAHARAANASRLTCEINVRPPNPESVRFHERHGFLEVATKESTDGKKTLSMRIKEL